MRFKIEIIFGLDIDNCIGLYVDDNILLEKIIAKYEGRCHRGLFVERVVKIVAQSDCVCNQIGPADTGFISVRCEIIAVRYAIGEIINGASVVSKERNSSIVICQTAREKIMMRNSPIYESITVGQIISARVGGVKYTPNEKSIAVNATPFLPSREIVVYKLTRIRDISSGIVKDSLARMLEEEERMIELKTTHKSAWDFHEQILQPYGAANRPALGSELSIMDLVAAGVADTIYVGRPTALSRPVIIKYGQDAPYPHIDNLQPEAVLIELIEDYCDTLRMIREYVEIYPPGEFEKHKNLWMIYKKNSNTVT